MKHFYIEKTGKCSRRRVQNLSLKGIVVSVLLLIFMAIHSVSLSQPWTKKLPQNKLQKKNLTFFEIQKAFYDYWRPFNVKNGYYTDKFGRKVKAPGWKQFKRWEWYWESRIDPKTGKFPATTPFAEFEKLYGFSRGSRTDYSSWSGLGPSSSGGGYSGLGRLNCIAFRPGDNNTFYAGSPSGGLWKTTDGGSTWIPLTDDNEVLGVSTAVVLAGTTSGTDTIYIGTGDRDGGSMWSLGGGQGNDNNSIGVLKSTDGGTTWHTTGLVFTPSQQETINRMIVDPSDHQVLYTATSAGLYKTTDAGTNWAVVNANDFVDIEFDPSDHNTIFASNWSGEIYKSTDAGANWTNVLSGTGGGRTELAVSPHDASVVYAVVANSGLVGVYKSTDHGNTFSLIFDGVNLLDWSCDGSNAGGQGGYDLAIAADPNNVNNVYVGGINTWKSSNGGSNWSIVTHWSSTCGGQATTVHADKHFLAFQNSTSTLFECNDGGLYSTSDGGASWTHLTNGMSISQMYRLGVGQSSSTEIIAGLQDNGTKTLSGGTWDDVIGGDGMECIIDYTNANVQFGELYYGSILKTTDHWTSSTDISSGISGSGWWVTPYVMDPNDHNTLYVGYDELWKTTDQGASWSQISSFGGNTLRSIAVAPSNSNVIYAATTTTLYKTTDGGASWSTITGSLPVASGYITYVTVSNASADTVWVTLGGYNNDGVYESNDGGATWNNISAGLPAVPVMCVVQNKQDTLLNELYAGTDAGVFLKLGSDDWTPYASGLPNVVVTELEIYYDNAHPENSLLRAATFGRGLMESPVYPPTGIVIADFTADNTSGTFPFTVNFTDLSSGNVTSWQWDFGDGGTSTDQNPSYTYTTAGIYSVTLIATGPSDADTVTKTDFITVLWPPPTADFTASPTSGVVPLAVNFTDLTTGNVDSWQWDFGDGQTSMQQNPSHTYNNAGIYTVSLIASMQGSSDTMTKVNYISAIQGAVYAGPDTTICTGTDYTVVDAYATGASSIIWTTTGTGTFDYDTIIHPTYFPGIDDSVVILTLTATYPSGNTQSDFMVLTVLPTPALDAGQSFAACANETINLSASQTSCDTSTILWTSSNGGTFSDPFILDPVYYPSAAEFAAGVAHLTITAEALSPCTGTLQDTLMIQLTPLPTVDAGSNQTVCGLTPITLTATATNYDPGTIEWTGGSGTFSNPASLSTTYFPATADLNAGIINLTVSVNGQSPCNTTVSDFMQLTLYEEISVDVGPDVTTCNDPYQLDANTTDASSFSWETSGTGTFSNPAVEDPIYYPSAADVAGGSVILTLTATATSPCTGEASDFLIMYFNQDPQANAGPDDIICESTSSYELLGASASNYTQVTWTTSGSGTFSNNQQVNPIYYPSSADIASGFVDLTITADNYPCPSAQDYMRLYINSEPTVDAGPNQNICVGDLVMLDDANATDYNTLQWVVVSGAGSFNDPTVLNPIFTPSTYSVNPIILRLTATATSPCTTSVFDEISIYITDPPTADAGISSDTICETDSYTILTASATNYSAIQWTSSGDGTWSGQNTLAATYFPGTVDKLVGSVVLTLSASPNSPCAEPATSDLTLYITSLPEVDAGDDAQICQNESYTLADATASGYSAISWTTSGSGTFNSTTILNPTYTPSAADYALGSVTLQLTATGELPCTSTVNDEMELSFIPDPTVDAGSDATICGNGEPYYIADATASNYGSLSWTTSGDGTFDNPSFLHPNYTPGPSDVASGSVTLELTGGALNPCSGFDTDQMTITIEPMPEVYAGADNSVCEGDVFTCSDATAVNYDNLQWTTTGTGSFNNDNTLNPVYTPSSDDLLAGSVYLRLTAYGSGLCSGDYDIDSLLLTFVPEPVADAGPDENICETGFTVTAATASNYSTVLWTSSGSSGTLTNANTLSPTYTPSASDIAAGFVTLTLTANANNPCTSTATDDMLVIIHPAPTADAGPDATICENDSYTIIGSATDYLTVSWSTSGDGTFVNSNTLTPTYFPGTNDISYGAVMLTLTANALAPCVDPATDNMVLSIERLPVVEAGSNVTICENDSYTTVEAVATDYSSLLWTSSGTGSFDNAAMLNTTYTPSAADILNGSVTLTLTATGSVTCNSTTVSDDLTITFQDLPLAYAGEDTTICTTDSYTITDATASNYSTVLWTSSGNGTFANANTLTPTYTPGPADSINGYAILTLTAYGISPCTGSTTDEIVLTVDPGPSVDVGPDDQVCDGDNYLFTSVVASNYSSFTWSTSGTGVFLNANTLSPTYIPSSGDATLGSVVITLTLDPNAPCISQVSDQMTLTVIPNALVDAGPDGTGCEGEIFAITGATASNYQSLQWTSSGTGVFTNSSDLNTGYMPSAADAAAGSVILTLTATPNAPCTSSPSSSMTLTVEPASVADAGNDGVVCQSGTFTVTSASAQNYTSVNWTHDGLGTLLNAGTLTPTYIPVDGDLVAGSVTLTLTVTGNSPCGTDTDDMEITIQPDPLADAGPDAQTCENQNYDIINATATDYSSLHWTTSGTGTFSNPNILHPEYIPSAADITNGNVVLTLTATGINPCVSTSSDQFILYFIPAPVVDAGVDETICEGSNITITTATGSQASSYQWSTTGTGSFLYGNTLTPVYQPSTDDENLGSVQLILTGMGNAPCASTSDTMTLFITPLPSADAGMDDATCENTPFTVTTAQASDYSSLNWTSSGTGTFSGGNTLTPTYTPSAADAQAGLVILTLEAFPNAPCSQSTTSSMQLTIIEGPTVDAGSNGDICEPDNFEVTDAQASQYSVLNWTSSGTGIFTNNGTLTPTYIPSAADYISGHVTLTLTATGIGACTGTVSDDMELYLQPAPVADAGPDDSTCFDAPYTVQNASVQNGTTYYWLSSGTGTLQNPTTLTPTYIPSAADLAAGSVELQLHLNPIAPCANQVVDAMVLTFVDTATVDAGPNVEVCKGAGYYIENSSATNYSALQWTTNGTGFFSNPAELHPTYYASSDDENAGVVTLVLTATPVAPCSNPVSDYFQLSFTDGVIAYAGQDAGICEGENYTIFDASVTHDGMVVWTSTGTGQFDDPTNVNPTYTPSQADINNGSVDLIMTATGTGACQGTSDADTMVLSIQWNVFVDAGGDQHNCSLYPYTITNASAQDYDALLWTTSGTGTFSDATVISPVYTPSNADLAAGSVTLTLTGTSIPPCTVTQSDSFVLYFQEPAGIFAGNDNTITAGQTYTVQDATGSDYSTLQWTTSGDGTFDDVTILNPTYTPGSGDIGAGTVTLSVTAQGLYGCPDSTDSMVLTILPAPVVDAGSDDTICEGQTYTLSGASAANYATLQWTTSGDGVFNNNSLVNPTYTPGTNDISNGIVTLYITATCFTGCPPTVDSMYLFINNLATANAGGNLTSCSMSPVSIDGATASGYSRLLWTTSGTGIFSDSTSLTTSYQPSVADYTAGSVNLTLWAYPLAPCSDTAHDAITLTFLDSITVFAGVDTTICEGNGYTLADATASNYSSLLWTTSGTGSFSDTTILHPLYSPSGDDINNGSVYLKLTAYDNPGCSPESDSMLLTIQALPEAYAGNDGSVCETGMYFLGDATGNVYDSLLWTTTGDGTFTDPHNLHPYYSPGPNDASVGSTTLILTLYGAAPCVATDSDSLELTIEPPPVDFTFNTGCLNGLTDFEVDTTVTNVANVTQWQWDFDDGSNSNLMNPSHIYTATGTYNVSLTIFTSDGCTNTVQHNVTINPLPVADFSSDAPACPFDSVHFTNSSWSAGTTIVTWIWEFGDGTQDTVYFPHSPDVAHLYTASGMYNVVLTVIDDNNCTNTTSDSIEIIRSPLADFTFDSACLTYPVHFTDLTQENGGGTITSWYWNFGDTLTGTDNTSTLQNPDHTFSGPGTFNTMLIATNVNGCSDTAWHDVTVDSLPDADFTMSTPVTCLYNAVEFTGISQETLTWQWDFGDGTTATGQIVQHTYTSVGTFMVTATATDAHGCMSTVSKFVSVSQAPVTDFTYSVLVCDTLQFTDQSTAAPGYNLVMWHWDFGDGDTSNLQNPVHAYAQGGNYDVTLIVFADSLGYICSDTTVKTVNVPLQPDIFYTWDPDPTCLGDTTNFHGTSGFPITTWLWDFTDGYYAHDSIAHHLFADTGVYNVILTITDTNGCVNSLTHGVTVKPVPAVTITLSDSILCAGAPLVCSGSSPDTISSWYWDFGDGTFSTEQNPVHYYTSGGHYTVSLTATDTTGCSNTVTKEVLVSPTPTADYSYSIIACTQLAFTDQSSAPAGYNLIGWYWDFDDGTTSTLQNPLHDFPATGGLFNVMLVVTSDSAGYSCQDTAVQSVMVPEQPSVFFTWDPEPAMLGNATSFYGTSGNTISSWYWDFGDGTFSTDQNPTHTYATVGTFTVTLTVTDDAGCTNSISHDVTVVNVPDLDFYWDATCVDSPVQFHINDTVTDVNAVVSWNWDFGDGGTSTEMEPQHTYLASGSYDVTLTIVDTMNATNSVTKIITIHPLPFANFSTEEPTCQGNSTQFRDHSTSESGYITLWHWDFGDGTDTTILFPDDPDVTHTYAGSGPYTVTLTVVNSDSCVNSTTGEVSIQPAPIALFTHSDATCASQPVAFTDQSQENGGGPIVSWLWDFGDPASGSNNSSTLQNPSHLFSASGSYDVLLTVENINGCTDTNLMTITIGDDPEVDFSFTLACLGAATQFEVDTTVTNTQEVAIYNWDFGDGGSSNLPNPTHTYATQGDYVATLTIITIDGCSATAQHTVHINPLPTANFASNAPVCFGDTVFFTNLSSSQNGLITRWDWDFGDGTTVTVNYPDDPDVSHLYTNATTFAVVLTVTDTLGCQNSVTKLIDVSPNPVADFSYEETCYGEPVYYTDLSTPNGGTDIQTWDWYFGDPQSGVDNHSTLQNPTHIYTEPGTYTTTLIISNTLGCTDTTEQDITVDSLPYVAIGIEDDSICLGEPANFTGMGTDINTWYWDFGDGGSSIEQNPSYTYSQPGTYVVTLTVTGIDGCENSATDTVYVNDAPTADFTYENTCINDSTYFTDASNSPNGYLVGWNWDFGDGNTSTEQNPVHLYATIDNYQVTLIVTDNFGCSDTITQWVEVYDRPQPAFTYNQVCEPEGQVYFFDESQPGVNGSPIQTWNWTLYEGYYSSEINPGYIYPQTDTCYTVSLEVTDANGCSAGDTVQVCLFPTVTGDFTATEECQGQPTFFQSTYGPDNDSIASYTWDFHDGTPQEVTYHDTISHIFPAAGTYLVELILADTNGCDYHAFNEVTVDSLPIPMFSYVPGFCDEPTLFTDESQGGGEFIQSWYWDFGDGTFSTEQNPAHYYGPLDSTYIVKLIITNFNGCTDSIEQEVNIAPCLVADFTVSDTIAPCSGKDVVFYDNSVLSSNNGDITTWHWDFGDGATYDYTAYQQMVSHSYAQPGTYDVMLVVTADIGGNTYSDTTVNTIEIHPTPEAGITISNNCLGDSTYFFDATVTGGSPLTGWKWDFDTASISNDTSNLQNPVYLYPGYGSYVVSLIVNNAYGCADTATDMVTIYKPPQADFEAEETCMTYNTYFTDLTQADSSSIASWNWEFDTTYLAPPFHNDDTSSLQNPVYIYDTSGTYVVRLITVDSNSCSDTIEKPVTIYPIPTANFNLIDRYEGQQGHVYLENLSSNAISYFWDLGNGVLTDETNVDYQYQEDGKYDIMLIAYNSYNCPDTLIQEYDLLFTNLYVPNAFAPGSDNPEISIFKPKGTNLKRYTLEVYSGWGNLVFRSSKLEDGQPAEGWDGTYNGQDMPTGTYIWSIQAEFKDGTFWKGSDNGDGNINTSGTVTLIR